MNEPRNSVLVRLLVAVGIAATLSPVFLKAASSSFNPTLSLSGGTPVTQCFMGFCSTTQWWCPTDPNNDWNISVTGATAESSVTLRRWHYEGGLVLRYEQEVGTTDENGEFQYSTTPAPPSDLGEYWASVVIDGSESNLYHYALGLGFC